MRRVMSSLLYEPMSGAEIEHYKERYRAQYPMVVHPPWQSFTGDGAMNDLSYWPPEWKEIQNCPEYEVIRPYLLYPEEYANARGQKFLDQLRDSRGYDVTFHAKGSCLLPLGPKEVDSMPATLARCKAVVNKINERAPNYNEFYELEKFVKLVAVALRRKYLLTFTVRETSTNEKKTVQAYVFAESPTLIHALEWRFKPGDSGSADSDIDSPSSS